MRILFLSNVFPNRWQPTKGTFNRSMMEALAETHGVKVISPISWLDALRGRKQNSIDADTLTSVETHYPRFYYPPKVLRSQFHQFMWHSIRRSALRVAHDFQPDVVLSYWGHPDGATALKLARKVGAASVSMIGGSDVLLLARSGARRKAILHVLKETDAIVPVSDHLAGQMIEDGIDSAKLHTIYRGIDQELFSPGNQNTARERLGIPSDRPVLLSVGRLVSVKAHHHLVHACELLQQQSIPLRCYIAGSGPLHSELTEQIQSANLSETVKLIGPQSAAQLADWYRAADVTVLPSLSEGIPNVLWESMSCGTPFVASAVGGIPEIADSYHDRLVTPDDPNGLAAEIRSLLQTAPPTAPRTVLPQSWAESSRQLTEVFESVAATPEPVAV